MKVGLPLLLLHYIDGGEGWRIGPRRGGDEQVHVRHGTARHGLISCLILVGGSRGSMEAGDPDAGQLPAGAAGDPVRDAHLPSERALQGTSRRALRAPKRIPSSSMVRGLRVRDGARQTGEICLDLLKTSWSPAYTITQTLTSIHQLLTDPEPDSPLNVDIASLLRQGDRVGAESLVRYYTREYRWQG